jgi:signal peptidase I
MSSFLRRYQENTKLLSTLKFIADIIMIALAAYVIVLFTCQRTNISGNSMQPVLENGDNVMINRFAYAYASPKRYDVIAFRTSGTGFNKIYIKRVIGIPGDKVTIKDGKVYINDAQLEDDVFTDNILTAGLASSPITLGKDEYFVLGDNRNNSEDSRFSNIGIVKKDNIIGSAWLITSPMGRFGFIR